MVLKIYYAKGGTLEYMYVFHLSRYEDGGDVLPEVIDRSTCIHNS